MGIINLHVKKINQLLGSYFDISTEKQVAIIGFPDLYQNLPLLEELFGNLTVNRSKVNENVQLTQLLQLKFNCTSTIFDISQHKGVETYLDLNKPLAEIYVGQYDFVIDSSCLEHCFNIAQAFQNLCDLVKVNGIVTTIAPVYDFHHGYFNVNPLFHEDGFKLNGFEILSQNIVNEWGDIIPEFGPKSRPHKSYILSTAVKKIDKKFEYPLQNSKPKKKKYDEI